MPFLYEFIEKRVPTCVTLSSEFHVKIILSTTMATFLEIRPSFLIIILLFAVGASVWSSEPTVYDILTKYSLPIGLLPDSVTSYTLSDDGAFEVSLKKPCYVQFDYLVYYEKKITGKLSVGSISDLKGIQVKKLFWFNVDAIKVDLPPSGSIYFQVGIINKELDAGQFETVHTCQDKALAACAASPRKIVQVILLQTDCPWMSKLLEQFRCKAAGGHSGAFLS